MFESDEVKGLVQRVDKLEAGIEGVARSIVDVSNRLSKTEEALAEFRKHSQGLLAEFNKQADKTDEFAKVSDKEMASLGNRVRQLEAQVAKLAKKQGATARAAAMARPAGPDLARGSALGVSASPGRRRPGQTGGKPAPVEQAEAASTVDGGEVAAGRQGGGRRWPRPARLCHGALGAPFGQGRCRCPAVTTCRGAGAGRGPRMAVEAGTSRRRARLRAAGLMASGRQVADGRGVVATLLAEGRALRRRRTARQRGRCRPGRDG